MPNWSGSDRRSRLPADWPARRRRVLRRDKYCTECLVSLSVEVDHIIPGDDHSDGNLRGLCRNCHGRKSGYEGGIASVASRRAIAAARKRPEEEHPSGL